jgi:hypothetical protein
VYRVITDGEAIKQILEDQHRVDVLSVLWLA